MQDLSDAQYRTFRLNLPYVGALILLHPLCRRVYNALRPAQTSNGSSRSTYEAGEARLEQRTSFDFAFAIFFLIILHGFSAAKVLLILYANYKLVMSLPRRHIPIATWVFNVGILFANELSQGYKFRRLAELLVGGPALDVVSDEGMLLKFGSWLDHHGGLNPRWEILFNITILRLISFNLDYYWSLDRRGDLSIEV